VAGGALSGEALARALGLHREGQLAAAEAAYREILEAEPSNVEALHRLGALLTQAGRPREGAELMAKAAALEPRSAALRTNLALAWNAAGEPVAALAAADDAAALEPGLAEAHSHRGEALRALGRLDEALASFDRALELKAGLPRAIAGRNQALAEIGCRHADEALALLRVLDPEGALAAADAAVAAAPEAAHVQSALGHVQVALRDHAGALASFDRAIAAAGGDNPEAELNKATVLLTLGRCREAWPLYEARKRVAGRFGAADLEQPAWTGAEPLEGRVIYVHAEQGLGDMIQFVRFLPVLAERGAEVVLSAPEALAGLFVNLHPRVRVVSGGERVAFHHHCALASLPFALGAELDDLPGRQGYLSADPVPAAAWKARMAPLAGPRVGVVWRGNPGHPNDRNRSIPFRLFSDLLQPGCSWVSLQQSHSQREAGLLRRLGVWNLADRLTDMAQTAAVVANLDLVVTVDTSVAHLVGALGKPVWVLVPYSPDWRWLTEREDSPWYASARLFRQRARGDWGEVITRLADQLKQQRGLA